MSTRSLIARAGTFFGLVLVAIIWRPDRAAILLADEPRTDGPADGDRQHSGRRDDDRDCVRRHRSLGGLDDRLCTVVIAQLLRMNVSPLFAALGPLRPRRSAD
jgi:hypothetical protein